MTNCLKMFKKFRLYISPYFLTRFYLMRDVKTITEKYGFKGKIIDVGCGDKPFSNLFKNTHKYLGIDFKNYSINKDLQTGTPDYFFDKNYPKTFRLPFANNSFDHSVSFHKSYLRCGCLKNSRMIRGATQLRLAKI